METKANKTVETKANKTVAPGGAVQVAPWGAVPVAPGAAVPVAEGVYTGQQLVWIDEHYTGDVGDLHFHIIHYFERQFGAAVCRDELKCEWWVRRSSSQPLFKPLTDDEVRRKYLWQRIHDPIFASRYTHMAAHCHDPRLLVPSADGTAPALTRLELAVEETISQDCAKHIGREGPRPPVVFDPLINFQKSGHESDRPDRPLLCRTHLYPQVVYL